MTEDVKDRSLPGGSLLSAYLDRQLMIWSDRGGASRHIGDQWAAHCSRWLDQVPGQSWDLPDEQTMTVTDVLRLDDVQGVSKEANHYHLENPDFLLFGFTADEPDTAIVVAVDAKFAADRIKPSQVNAATVDNLLTVPETGVTRSLVDDVLEDRGYADRILKDGAFLCPDSTLTEFLLHRRSRNRALANEPAPIVRIRPAPETMFSDVPAHQLVGILARQDRLPVAPRENLLSTLYYFRVACACVYLWQEQHLPLFSNEPADLPEVGLVGAELARRVSSGKSAYRLMLELVDEAETVQRARQAVANVASLPLRIAEIRSLLQATGQEGEKQALRTLRRDLEIEFREKLFAQVGVIQASDPRPLGEILDQIAKASRDLRDHMRDFAVTRAQNLQLSVPAKRTG